MTGVRHRWTLSEFNGALGDTGTLLPLVIGAITVGGLSATPVLIGFAIAYLLTGLVYRLPVPVQPMKAIAALIVVGEISPDAVALSGVMMGAVLVILGATGAINRLARLVPRSIIAGLRLGLGASLAWVATGLMMGEFGLATASLALLTIARIVKAPSALLLLVAGFGIAAFSGASTVHVEGPQTLLWILSLDLSLVSDTLTDLVLPRWP